MSASQPALFNIQEFTDAGVTLVGGRLYTYAFGTTAQKIAYTDPEGTVPQTYTADGLGGQYIALNARGELPTPLYLGKGVYDIALKRADSTTVWTRRADGVDNLANSVVENLSGATGAAMVGGASQVVSSIPGLRGLLKTSPSKSSFVTGYWSAGDGGGGPYYLDAADTVSADDGCTVIVAADGGRWKLSQSFAPSLAQYGVKRGMTSGDQTAAINAVLLARLGKQTYAGTGDYRVDGSLLLSNGSRLTCEKNARFWRSATYTTNTAPVLYVLDSYTEFTGGLIQTDNGSPTGVVTLGHMSNTDERNAWYWRFCDVDLQGNGVAGSIGWAVISGQISFPLNANYFGLVRGINTKNFDIGCFFGENANAHNISNCHFWQCRTANIWLRGAYANNFNNMFFHGAAANGCIGIKLSNKAGGPDTDSNSNVFVGWTCETGGLLDQAIFIDTNCNGNILIGTSNVAGGSTINNYNNTVVVTGAGIGGMTILPGGGARTDGVISRIVTPITPAGLLGVGDTGGSLVVVEMAVSTNANLNRTDLLLISARNSGFSPSAVTLISSAWTNTGANGEPIAVAYGLSFASGEGLPRLTLNVTPSGPDVLYNVRCRLTQV
ncbi:hypothetical protein [Janthinobacterium sp. PSPC3-1]|uniref:hypothetical protein n=1 Tax=Janthinobacterium sp. PSPC3-1 TaxID=2804653 RepID=UPI003CF1240E